MNELTCWRIQTFCESSHYNFLVNSKYVTPTENFTAKFREIFTNTQIKHKPGKESRAWLEETNMNIGRSS